MQKNHLKFLIAVLSWTFYYPEIGNCSSIVLQQNQNPFPIGHRSSINMANHTNPMVRTANDDITFSPNYYVVDTHQSSSGIGNSGLEHIDTAEPPPLRSRGNLVPSEVVTFSTETGVPQRPRKVKPGVALCGTGSIIALAKLGLNRLANMVPDTIVLKT
jgi:hypothetical protein